MKVLALNKISASLKLKVEAIITYFMPIVHQIWFFWYLSNLSLLSPMCLLLEINRIKQNCFNTWLTFSRAAVNHENNYCVESKLSA